MLIINVFLSIITFIILFYLLYLRFYAIVMLYQTQVSQVKIKIIDSKNYFFPK